MLSILRGAPQRIVHAEKERSECDKSNTVIVISDITWACLWHWVLIGIEGLGSAQRNKIGRERPLVLISCRVAGSMMRREQDKGLGPGEPYKLKIVFHRSILWHYFEIHCIIICYITGRSLTFKMVININILWDSQEFHSDFILYH